MILGKERRFESGCVAMRRTSLLDRRFDVPFSKQSIWQSTHPLWIAEV
jgi:hypothetical protein